MRHHHLSNHKHQVIHADTRPLPPPSTKPHRSVSPFPQLNAHFPRTLQEEPHEIALLQSHLSPRHILRLEKHKRQNKLRAPHSFINSQILLPQRLFQQSFLRERGFRLRFRLHCDGAGGFEALFHNRGGLVFVVLSCRCRRCASGVRFCRR